MPGDFDDDLRPVCSAVFALQFLLKNPLAEKPVSEYQNAIHSTKSRLLRNFYDFLCIRKDVIGLLVQNHVIHHSTFLTVCGLCVSKICSKFAISASVAMPLSRNTA